jgi:hypothetical protein
MELRSVSQPMVIRDRQMVELGQTARGAFEERLLSHIQQFFPVHWREVGPERLREVIRLGMTNASTYGLETQREIYLYVSLILYFGSSFDSDFQLPWAADGLKNPSEADPFARIDATYNEGLKYLGRLAGPDGRYTGMAIERFTNSFQRLNSSMETFPEMLARIHPQKYGELNQAQISKLAQQGQECGFDSAVVAKEGTFLCGGLAMLLGCGFVRDPQFFWAKEVLQDPGDPQQRITTLKTMSAERLSRWFPAKGAAR